MSVLVSAVPVLVVSIGESLSLSVVGVSVPEVLGAAAAASFFFFWREAAEAEGGMVRNELAIVHHKVETDTQAKRGASKTLLGDWQWTFTPEPQQFLPFLRQDLGGTVRGMRGPDRASLLASLRVDGASDSF